MTNALDLGPGGQQTVIAALDNLPLPDFGPYDMRITLNDVEKHSTDLHVQRQVQQQG